DHQPTHQVSVGRSVLLEADGRGHVDDSFDQLRLLQLRHRLVAPLELIAGQVVPVVEPRYRRRGRQGRRGHALLQGRGVVLIVPRPRALEQHRPRRETAMSTPDHRPRRPVCLVVLLTLPGVVHPAAPPAGHEPLPPGAVGRLGSARFRHGAPVRSLAYSPDGQVLATAAGDRTVRLWEASTGVERRRLACPGEVGAVAFSPDGQVLAAATTDRFAGVICLWDAATGKVLRRLTGYTREVGGSRSLPTGGRSPPETTGTILSSSGKSPVCSRCLACPRTRA